MNKTADTTSDTSVQEPVSAPVAKSDLSTRGSIFNVGDKVRIHVSVKEGDKERVQIFEGNVIAKRRGRNGTFTVRKISFGIGVERTFPIASPKLEKIELVSRTASTRSKLYYLRNLTGKAARIAEVKES